MIPMKLNIQSIVSESSFWFVILIGLLAQAVPFALTLGLSVSQGGVIAGFPFPFVSYGGVCGAGECPRSFVPLHVLFDTVLIVGVAVFVAHIRSRKSGGAAL